uniref:YgiT-type zinc finger domain-containing protein n=1 Tax=Candidatus Kentrum sp. DK TaxID=2126562 RepID=A0A450S6G2_9GAMM|nr:MAG: YgiT-type zinc finger domain-containing protein [Candidatus Kentron sp. DK]
MECLHCKGKMIRKTAPFGVDRHGYHMDWEAVPAWVCTQCGGSLFEEHEVEYIQMALRKLDHETTMLASKVA